MKFLRIGGYYLLGVFGILCVSIFPQFFASGGIFDPLSYFKELGSFIVTFVQPGSWEYQLTGQTGSYRAPSTVVLPLFETIWPPFIYSMQIFLGALALGFSLAFGLAYISNFLSGTLRRVLKRVLDLLETVPDLVIAVLLQILAVYLYKHYEIDLFNVAGLGEDKIYFAPIVTLAIYPMISLFRILLLRMEEEFLTDYVSFLRSRGIKKSRVLVVHMFRNILPTVFNHSKIIIWGTLSSQFIIEYIFNVRGLSYFIIDSFTPMTMAVALLFIFTPFFVFFQLVELWLPDNQSTSQFENISQKLAFRPFESFKNWISGFRYFHWRQFKPWKPIINACKVLFSHIKNVKFVIGCLFFIIVLSISFGYSITTDNHIDQETIIYNEDGTIKSVPPHSPGEPFLLGSTIEGFDLLDQLIIGAKYTLLFGMLIAGLRVLAGLFGGVLFAFTINAKKQRWVEKLVDSIHFIPLTIIAYMLLASVLYVGYNLEAEPVYTMTQRIAIEVFVLTVLVIPLTTVLIGNEIKEVLAKEFVLSAKVLGVSKLRIFWKHVLPHIGPRLAILSGQQFIQVLLIFIHLGVFRLFFGGTLMSDPPASISYEWSGLIGNARNEIGSNADYWLALWPLLAFMLSIYAMQLVISGIKDVQQAKLGIHVKSQKKRRKNKAIAEQHYEPTIDSFKRVSG